MQYSDYIRVLDRVPRVSVKIKDDIYDDNNPVYNIINDYCKASSSKTFFVSLSGGVDSMVILSIIHYLGYDTIALHINYNNREETSEEQKFIENWCEFNDIKLYTHEMKHLIRSGTKRQTYEDETKQIRFNLYREIIHKENCDSVILAHHKDDTIENIITNFCRARSILNLSVLKSTSLIDGVKISRPLLETFKDRVYEFAHDNQVPYFKDTTPIWSIRGMLRRNLFPSLISTFKHRVKDNLLRIDQQSQEWAELIQGQIIEPFLEKCKFTDDTVLFNVDNYKKYSFCFWNEIFMKIFYKFNVNSPSNKSIREFMNFINKKEAGTFVLTKKTICEYKDSEVKIIFK